MIIKCLKCKKCFDDQFRVTDCPHDTFMANDGQNNFRHYHESYLSDKPLRPFTAEYNDYQNWLDKNRIRF